MSNLLNSDSPVSSCTTYRPKHLLPGLHRHRLVRDHLKKSVRGVMEWIYTSTSSMWLYGVGRGNCTFLMILPLNGIKLEPTRTSLDGKRVNKIILNFGFLVNLSPISAWRLKLAAYDVFFYDVTPSAASARQCSDKKNILIEDMT